MFRAQAREDFCRDLSLSNPAVTSTSEIRSHSISDKANVVGNLDAVTKNAAVDRSSDAPVDKDRSLNMKSSEFASFVLSTDNTQDSLTSTNSITVSTNSLSNNTTPHSHSTCIPQNSTSNPSALSREILPLIETEELDIREEISPITREKAAATKAEKRDWDTSADLEVTFDFGARLSNDTMDLTATGSNSNSSSNPVELLLSSLDEHPLRPASVSNIDLNATSQTDLALEISSNFEPTRDVNMEDAPQSPSKIVREREEDVEDGPSAKRTKTEGDGSAAPEFARPRAVTAVPNGNGVAAAGDDSPPTDYQQKELLKMIKHLKGTSYGRNFKASVEQLWPAFYESYRLRISNPIDLSIIEQRLKQAKQPGGYQTLAEFKYDVNLLYNNTLEFNGPEHDVTLAGAQTKDHIFTRIPPPEPVKQEKRRKGTPVADAAPRAAPVRRQSRGVATTAGSPTAASPAQTFALDPSGTPVIRRDSTKTDGGRPKREIHPPKSKDLPYNARPKKKKFATELKFCEEILNELKKPKYQHFAGPFLVPVDPVALSIPDYYKIIKNPMDLQTVETRLSSGQYENAKDFESDIKLIFKNCYKFNPSGSPVYELGKALEGVFNEEWAKKSQWIADHTTASNAASPNSAGESEDDESEEEEVEEPVTSSNALADRLIEEQNKLITIMSAKKPDQVMVKMQQDMIALIRGQMQEQAAKRAKATKTKPAKATKKGATSKKKSETSKRAYRVKTIGLVEKEQISAGITQLEGKLLDQAVAYLKMDFPNLNVGRFLISEAA
jgi:bromodomain-containing factor 1